MKCIITTAIVLSLTLYGSTQTIDNTYPDLSDLPRLEDIAPEITPVLTDTERDLIERVVAAEARGEPIEGQMAVAQVIKDRAELWEMTPVEVVSAPYQFAAPYGGEIPEETVEAVWRVFDGGERVITEPVTHFHSGSEEPYWTKSKISRGAIGGHRFWY